MVATETEWRRMTGPAFSSFQALCLEPSAFRMRHVRCPQECGCDHLVIDRHDGAGAVAVCRCNPPGCADLVLSRADITVLEVGQSRLGHALCRAFGLHSREAALSAPNSYQFGAWSSDAVPAILTIQVRNSDFRRAVAELVATLRQRFILFSPTSDFLDAPARGMLENQGAGFFDLKSHVTLTEQGTLRCAREPGELFARFNPQPRETDVNMAERVFALVQKLDTERPLKPPTLLTVFRLYCIEEMSSVRIARRFETTKTTVVRRLAEIEARIGVHPRALRRFSPHLAKLPDSARPAVPDQDDED
jgi:hypothetical protein